MIIILLLSISVLTLIIILFISFLRYDFYKNENMKKNKFDSKKFWFYVVLIVLLAILSYSVFIVNDRIERAENVFNKNITNEKSSQEQSLKLVEYEGTLGDLIGGVLNPIIALLGVFAGGLAFYMQYKANHQIQEQFKIQQFESQFYEMLHLHRENLNEMIIEGYEFDYLDDDKSKKAKKNSKRSKVTSGKKIFVTMLKEFEAIHLICKKHFFSFYKAQPEKLNLLDNFTGKQLIFDHAYYVYFNGVSFYKNNVEKYIIDDTNKTGLLNEDLIKRYIKDLERIRDKHQKHGIKIIKDYSLVRGIKSEQLKGESLLLSFNYKPFSGHQSILAHYYRHLFQTVKFVVKQDDELLSYESKRNYLRILRSMLSNHEQILLYYNWISGFGNAWEKKMESDHIDEIYNEKGNKFFTDYRMIHNIPNQMVISEFKLDKIFDGKYSNFKFEEGRKYKDGLFELINIVSKKQ